METLRVWTWYLSLLAMGFVSLISYLGGFTFLHIVLRSILAFALIYGMSEISFYLFEKTSLPLDNEVGALLDIAVGQEDLLYNLGQTPLPGQVNKELAYGLPSAEKQAEIVRRMGWGK
jgi:hypothetical protein